MRQAHDVETVRAAEAALMARLPPGALMGRAAAGLATVCGELLGRVYGARVVLLVGSGDNGGDALYAGAHLARRGARVDALLLAPDRAHAGGLAALRAAGGTTDPAAGTVPLTVAGPAGRAAGPASPAAGTAAGLLERAELVLDGIVGIGGSGGLRPEAAVLADLAARGPARVVAVDLPSGVDASTGEVPGAAVRAEVTVTFGTYKPGLLVDPGAGYAGVVRLVDIGLAAYLPAPAVEALHDADAALLLPQPARSADKYRRGVVGVVAGSEAYPGAAVLAVGGALRGGAGYVRLSAPRRVADAVLARWPETVVSERRPADAGRVQAWVIGPGLGTDEQARDRLADVLASDVPVLVDADALTLLASAAGGTGAAAAELDPGELDPGELDPGELAAVLAGRSAPTLLTPHAGEAARLLGVDRAAVEAAQLRHLQLLVTRTGATVLLKGATTLVAGNPAAGGPGPVLVNPTGTPWLGTAGSGDVLSGLVGSLLAAGLPPTQAASLGAYLHGRAGRLAAGGAPISASGLLSGLAEAWRSVAS